MARSTDLVGDLVGEHPNQLAPTTNSPTPTSCSNSLPLPFNSSVITSATEDEALTFYVCGEGCKAFPGLSKKKERIFFSNIASTWCAKVKMKQCSEYLMNSSMLNTPLYQREKIQSCHPAAGVCWTTLLLEEMASLNQETAGKERRAETESRI